MCLPCQSNSCFESDYGCICIVMYGKTRSVPLNILSSVYTIYSFNSNTVIVRKTCSIIFDPGLRFFSAKQDTGCVEHTSFQAVLLVLCDLVVRQDYLKVACEFKL